MPDGRLVKTGGLREFAELDGITMEQAKTLIEGSVLEVNGEALACQIVNGRLWRGSARRITPKPSGWRKKRAFISWTR